MTVEHKKEHNVHQRMDCVRQEVGYIQKDATVSLGKGGSHKAVSHDHVTAMLRQYLSKHGLLVLPSIVRENTTEGKSSTGSSLVRLDAVYNIAFINIDRPEDREVIQLPACAVDQGDKAPGKTMSYVKKYALLKAFDIETGENDESRVGPVDDDGVVPADELIKMFETIDAAESLEKLQNIVPEYLRRAASFDDKSAHAQIKDRGVKRAAQIAKPSTDVVSGTAEATSTAAPAQSVGEPASAGLNKTIVAVGKGRGLDEKALCTKANVKALSELTRQSGGAFLKSLNNA